MLEPFPVFGVFLDPLRHAFDTGNLKPRANAALASFLL
jgi:hypothetical protein